MTEGMLIVFAILAGAVALFASGRVRPDIVAILVILALNLSGVLTIQESLAGCGEFAFEVKFKRADELHDKAMDRGRQFFIALQQSGHDWLSLGTTKTGLVYRLKGNPPQAHE